MTQVVVPNYAIKPRSKLLWAIPAGLLLIAIAYFAVPRLLGRGGTEIAALPTYTVKPMNMDIRVIKDGELQAVNNIDIQCAVEGLSTIQELVKEGSSVKKGDVLAVIDSSSLKLKIEDTSLEVEKSTAELTTAREMRDIQLSQNSANIEAADVALQLARLDLQQYVEGSYPQQLKSAKTDVEMGDTTLKNKLEELDQTKRLFGKGFVNSADVKKSELEVIIARNALDKAQTALAVLSKYTHEMDQASKKNALAQAEQKLVRTKRENASNLAQKEADVKAKDQALTLLKRRFDRYQDQLVACVIKAPAEGLVVYASSGDRNAEKPIQEGGTVRERQLLFRLPDTTSMKAVVRVQEAQIGRVTEGMRAIVRLPLGLPPAQSTITKISVLADNAQRWWNPDLKEYPVELALDSTPSGLKPGMNALTEIFIDQLRDVIAVPLTTVYAAGADTFVFEQVGEHVHPIKVKLGQNTDTHVQVTEGVSTGQPLLVLQSGQGRELLEKAGIKPTPVRADSPDAKGKRKDRKDAAGEAKRTAPAT